MGKACRFLGGKLTYQTKHTCKVGKPHQWKRVVRCVKGAVISHKGLDYKTGMAHVSSNVRSLGMRRILLEDEHGYSVGFPGKEVGAAAIAEAGKAGQANDYFQLGQLKTGKFKGMYIFRLRAHSRNSWEPWAELTDSEDGLLMRSPQCKHTRFGSSSKPQKRPPSPTHQANGASPDSLKMIQQLCKFPTTP